MASLPKWPGVYVVYEFSVDGSQYCPIYVGQTVNFHQRFNHGHRDRFGFAGIKFAPEANGYERRRLERRLIKRLKPAGNVACLPTLRPVFS